MDRRISLQQVTETQDAFGQPIKSWSEVEALWAEVQPLSGNELFASLQLKAEVETRFRIRYRAGVTPELRIFYAGHGYDIVAVHEIGRREGLDILAKARAEAAA